MSAAGTLLYLDGVTVSFDGFRALNALSLVLAPGEMRAVIGPNGAGKTTMMDVITGKTRPESGAALNQYRRQVAFYAAAVSKATGKAARGVLMHL